MEKERNLLPEMSEYSFTGDVLYFPFVYKVQENEKNITALEFLRDNLIESVRDALLNTWENMPDVYVGAIYSEGRTEIYLVHTQPFKEISAIYPFAN